jgi:hypothetical protein
VGRNKLTNHIYPHSHISPSPHTPNNNVTIQLHSIGYGDICPSSKASIGGKFFILAISMLGLGVFCGPLLSVTSAWRHQVPGGIITLSAFTLAMGTSIFSMVEGVDTLEAVYASIITGTTIGYGDLTPATDMGKMLVALYALLVVNVMGALLETGKEYLLRFCMLPPQLAVPDSVAAHVASEVKDKKDL